ncbi:universal stress protein UspA [Maritimibacter sp. 55A14]|uniref:universal stress protein n=1 Tax=Maritimibacter sp. 55A14 TaxID=2174844 RepID=UPI000D60D7EC|nr:universal stress protein [Maritimibacter sp. 55A14]PWE33609.1 universal stress protein UspA [Maritimibacter sp. 55A14]
MYNKIMVPIDLRHTDQLGKAIKTAAELSKAHDASLTFVGVTNPQPSAVAHNPKEYESKLAEFAAAQSKETGVEIGHISKVSHDPAIDKDDILEEVVEGNDFDLVVMASHVPGIAERIFASNAGYLASHAKVSVFVVRG